MIVHSRYIYHTKIIRKYRLNFFLLYLLLYMGRKQNTVICKFAHRVLYACKYVSV